MASKPMTALVIGEKVYEVVECGKHLERCV